MLSLLFDATLGVWNSKLGIPKTHKDLEEFREKHYFKAKENLELIVSELNKELVEDYNYGISRTKWLEQAQKSWTRFYEKRFKFCVFS